MSRRLELVDLFLALAATAMTEVLIIFALVDAHASVAMVAGTVVGVLSGISATSDVGYELGNMIRASVSISGFLHMLDALTRRLPRTLVRWLIRPPRRRSSDWMWTVFQLSMTKKGA